MFPENARATSMGLVDAFFRSVGASEAFSKAKQSNNKSVQAARGTLHQERVFVSGRGTSALSCSGPSQQPWHSFDGGCAGGLLAHA